MGVIGVRGNKTLALVAIALGVSVGVNPTPAQISPTVPPAHTVELKQSLPPLPVRRPHRFAVVPFENRSRIAALDWMSAAVPFALAEKVERVAPWAPAYGSLVVPATKPSNMTEAEVLSTAQQVGAKWLWTGWFRRAANWDLVLGIALWRIDGISAHQVDEVVARGDFATVHRMTAKGIEELCGAAGISLVAGSAAILARAPTADHYAFTLFGRGLAAMLGTAGPVDLEKADKDLTRAVFIDPTLASAHRVLGHLLDQGGHTARARSRVDFALTLEPTYYAAKGLQAQLATRAGNLREAIRLYTAMIRQRPWAADARFRYGELLWRLGRGEAAFTELSHLVRVHSDHLGARRVLVLIHAARGNTDDLADQLRALVRLDPHDVATRMDLAAALLSLEEFAQAQKAYEQILAMQPKHVHALKLLADLHKSRSRIDDAIGLYRRAIKARGNDPRAYFLLAETYIERGNLTAAKRVYRRAQRFRSRLGIVYSHLGAIAYREGNLAEALWYLRRAVPLATHDATVRYNYASALSASGSLRDALVQANAGLKLAPKHAGLRYARGVIMLRLGRRAGAQRAFESVLSVVPHHTHARHNLAVLRGDGEFARLSQVR